MKIIGAYISAVAITLALCLIANGAQAARLEMETKSLKGIVGVYVVVETPAADLQADGLDDHAIESLINERLSAAGIKTLSEAELSKPGAAIFYVGISSVKNTSGLYACSIHAEVIQAAALSRDPNILTPATTWTSSTMGIVNSSVLRTVNDSVVSLTNEFIRDFLRSNSKPIIKPKIA